MPQLEKKCIFKLLQKLKAFMDRIPKSDTFKLAVCNIYGKQLFPRRTQKLLPTDESLWCAKAIVTQD